MEIRIESPHFTVNSLLEEYIMRKVNKLSHFNERLIWAQVLLKLDKADRDDNKICEIKVHGPGEDLFAFNKCITFEDAITETIKSIEKQMRKRKTQWKKGKEKMHMEDISDDTSIE